MLCTSYSVPSKPDPRLRCRSGSGFPGSGSGFLPSFLWLCSFSPLVQIGKPSGFLIKNYYLAIVSVCIPVLFHMSKFIKRLFVFFLTRPSYNIFTRTETGVSLPNFCILNKVSPVPKPPDPGYLLIILLSPVTSYCPVPGGRELVR